MNATNIGPMYCIYKQYQLDGPIVMTSLIKIKSIQRQCISSLQSGVHSTISGTLLLWTSFGLTKMIINENNYSVKTAIRPSYLIYLFVSTVSLVPLRRQMSQIRDEGPRRQYATGPAQPCSGTDITITQYNMHWLSYFWKKKWRAGYGSDKRINRVKVFIR